jgi:hypothetical protein
MLPDSVLSHYESLPPPKKVMCVWGGIHVVVVLFGISSIAMANEDGARPTVAYEAVWIVVQTLALGAYGLFVLARRRYDTELGILAGSCMMMALLMLTMSLLSSAHIVSQGQTVVTAAELWVSIFAIVAMVGYVGFASLIFCKRGWITKPMAPPTKHEEVEDGMTPEKVAFILKGVDKMLTEAGMTQPEINHINKLLETPNPPKWNPDIDLETMMQGPEEFARLLKIVTGICIDHQDGHADMMDIIEESTVFSDYGHKYHGDIIHWPQLKSPSHVREKVLIDKTRRGTIKMDDTPTEAYGAKAGVLEILCVRAEGLVDKSNFMDKHMDPYVIVEAPWSRKQKATKPDKDGHQTPTWTEARHNALMKFDMGVADIGTKVRNASVDIMVLDDDIGKDTKLGHGTLDVEKYTHAHQGHTEWTDEVCLLTTSSGAEAGKLHLRVRFLRFDGKTNVASPKPKREAPNPTTPSQPRRSSRAQPNLVNVRAGGREPAPTYETADI